MKKCLLPALAVCIALLGGCRLFGGLVGPAASPAATQPAAADEPGRTASRDTAGAQTKLPEGLVSVQPESTETPAPTVASATGEIPEAQKFVPYSSADGGYDIQAPEGWKKEEDGRNVSFTKRNSGVKVEVADSTEPFTVEAVGSNQVAELVRKGRAVAVKNMEFVETMSGQAILVEYESNSEPDGDGKKVRLDNKRYYYFKEGKLAALTLWAPAGVNNENIWKQIPDTFFWR